MNTGPYARIPHPIYLALPGFLTSIALIVLLAFSIVDLSLRMPKEEKMMMEEFGEGYRAHVQKTVRSLPR